MFINKISTFIWYCIFNKAKIFEKRVDVMYITENKQINELYKAVYWYLSTTDNVDYINEPYLQFACDQKSIMSGVYDINKIINQNREKKIKYKFRSPIEFNMRYKQLVHYMSLSQVNANLAHTFIYLLLSAAK